MNTQYRKNLKAVLNASKSYTDSKIEDLKWELGTYDLSISSDTTTAYTKSVPSGAIKGKLNIVGGMSYKSENLYVLTEVAQTTTNYGITYKVENGVIYLSGTVSSEYAYANAFIELNLVNTIPSGTYAVGYFNSTADSTVYVYNSDLENNEDYTLAKFLTATNMTSTGTMANGIKQIRLRLNRGNTYNIIIKPMLVKGSTAPTEYQPYFAGIRDTAITSITSKDSNNTTLDTLTIDSNIQALSGYGWGVNSSVYNYIDFESKKFIQKVGRVDLGSLDWNYNTTYEVFYSYVSSKKPSRTNIISAIYTTVDKQYQDLLNMEMSGTLNDTGINIKNTSYTDTQAFKTAMSGIYLYYELATPIETDISEYIDNNDITIEANGTITFNNTYNQAVPSDIDYLIEEVKA